MNLPKYTSKADLKRQYHKLAKIYHPDLSRSNATPSEAEQKRREEKFKDFNQAYERLQAWVDERDAHLDESLRAGSHPSGVRLEKEEGSKDAE